MCLAAGSGRDSGYGREMSDTYVLFRHADGQAQMARLPLPYGTGVGGSLEHDERLWSITDHFGFDEAVRWGVLTFLGLVAVERVVAG